MNINTNLPRYNTQPNTQQSPSFGNGFMAVSEFLRFLNTNQAVGATIVDFGSMAAPRTIIDAQRGMDACIETGIRENSGTANHVAIGAIGAMAAFALGSKINKEYNIKSHGIFANNDTIDILGRFWHENCHGHDGNIAEIQESFFNKVLDNLKCRGQVIEADTKEKVVKALVEVAQTPELTKELKKDKLSYITNLVTSATGAENDLKLSFKPGLKDAKEVCELNVGSFMEDLIALTRTFSKKEVLEKFKPGDLFENNAFIKDLKGVKMRSAILALGISSTIGACVQPFNRWLTKKRTGSDGFVGVSNNPDVNKNEKPSSGFFAAKLAAAAGMLGIAFAAITTNPKDFFSKIQFKGKLPTLAHYKLVYGVTVASRFLAARDKNELRESVFKDILGFTNWLILGGVVSKSIAYAANRNTPGILNESKGEASSLIGRIFKSSVKTVDEVLLHDLKAKNISVVEDGKAIPFKKLLQLAKDNNMTDTLKKVKWLNWAQVGGYAYSAIVLGILLPKANILMTNYFNKKQQNGLPSENKNSSPVVAVNTLVSTPSVFSKFEAHETK